MEENIVKLIGITIKELYGCYNYEVNFNSDVTFIYGANGCGKTTILNITEAIITGQLFKLFNYDFKNIELKYANSSNLDDVKTISIYSEKTEISVIFNGQNYLIKIIDSEDNIRSMRSTREISRFYLNRYDFLTEIRKTFNYVYLPLNRSYISYDESEEIYPYPRFHNKYLADDDVYIGNDNRDGAMIKIESLIYQKYSRANVSINRINDSFRNSMLKPQIELSNTYDFKNFLNEIKNYDIPKLKKTQTAYIKILKDFKLIDEAEEDNYNSFFKNFIKEFSHFVNNNSNNEGFPLDLFFKFQEISRIQKTIEIAKKMEQKKAAVTKPMETFLSTMNNFIKNSEDGKEICINNDGQVFFKTKYSQKQISIQHLSSGEKQLITFFANLIFKVKDKSSGIFVVDEPELSLHLSWQKIFIDKVLEINKDIQLIFATHAPEIIGRRRDKMYKLEKIYTKAE